MVRIAFLTTLVAYSIVVSQPLAYLFFMSKAQRALSAPGYIELRQHINSVMNRRVPVVYLGTVAMVLLLLVLSVRSRSWSVLMAATVALVCLVVDMLFMMRENVPINGVVDRWSTTAYPEDWEDYRTKWFAVFSYRQAVLLLGFLALLVGAVLH